MHALPPRGAHALLRVVRSCRGELREKFDRGARDIEVAEYEPKMNVTPNAVALKDD